MKITKFLFLTFSLVIINFAQKEDLTKSTQKNTFQSLSKSSVKNTALSFDGKDDVFKIPIADDSLNAISAFTIECWVYFRTLKNDYNYIFARVDSGAIIDYMGSYGDHYLARIRRSDTALTWQVNNSETSTYTHSLDEKTWYHFSFTCDGEEIIRVLVNGEEKAVLYTGFEELSVDNGTLQFGSYKGKNGLDGIINEIRIWNYVLSPEEIKRGMNKKLTGEENGLVAYWQFDEGKGQSVSDLAGDNNGVLGNSKEIEENDPKWIECEISPTGVEGKHSGSIKKFNLQNYPNPFNTATTIKFTLPKNGFVDLSIYNIKGQLIETLIHDKINHGVYKKTWEAKNFSSGIYFYRIKTEEYSRINKCVLIK